MGCRFVASEAIAKRPQVVRAEVIQFTNVTPSSATAAGDRALSRRGRLGKVVYFAVTVISAVADLLVSAVLVATR